MSGDRENLGEILNSNVGVVGLFGYTLNELCAANISKLMCAPMSLHHTSYIMRYFETGESSMINKRRLIFGLHKSGYMIPIDIFIRVCLDFL